jgi:hypothetical protein
LGFGSKGPTAHSRDLPEFNLRGSWLLAAAKAVSHSKKNERERNLPTARRRSGNRAAEEHPPR